MPKKGDDLHTLLDSSSIEHLSDAVLIKPDQTAVRIIFYDEYYEAEVGVGVGDYAPRADVRRLDYPDATQGVTVTITPDSPSRHSGNYVINYITREGGMYGLHLQEL